MATVFAEPAASDWLAYVRRCDPILRCDAAQHPRCPPEVLEFLIASPAARYYVAINRCCPPHLLAVLCADPDPQVRQAAVRNKNCPDHLRAIVALAH